MVCLKCGYEDDSGHIAKRVERGSSQTCSSCRARPAKTVDGPHGKCKPWHGAFDQDDNPLDDHGNQVLPGFRKCGHSDCIEQEHIFSAALSESLDISYRTGIKLTPAELWHKLMGERVLRRRGK